VYDQFLLQVLQALPQTQRIILLTHIVQRAKY